jgi:hypothetical protein
MPYAKSLRSVPIFSNLASCICAFCPTYCIYSQIWMRFTLYAVRPTYVKSTPGFSMYIYRLFESELVSSKQSPRGLINFLCVLLAQLLPRNLTDIVDHQTSRQIHSSGVCGPWMGWIGTGWRLEINFIPNFSFWSKCKKYIPL